MGNLVNQVKTAISGTKADEEVLVPREVSGHPHRGICACRFACSSSSPCATATLRRFPWNFSITHRDSDTFPTADV
jgi:hypothetical protein